MASKRQRLEEKRQQVNIAIQVSLTAGVPPIRSPPATFSAGTAAKPVVSARRRVVEEHYKRAVPEGISPLLAAKEAPKGPATAAVNDGRSFDVIIAKTCTQLNSLSFLVPTKRRVARTTPVEAPAPTRLTRSERSRIPVPKPSYVTALWKEGRHPPREPTHDDLVKDGKILRPVLKRIDADTNPDISEAETEAIIVDTSGERVTDGPVPGPSQKELIPSDSETDIEDIIFRVRNSYTPQQPKKERKKRVVKQKTPSKKSAKRTPKSPPPAADNEDLVGNLFGSVSEDEDKLLAEPEEKPAPTEAAAEYPAEDIEIDIVDLELNQEDETVV